METNEKEEVVKNNVEVTKQQNNTKKTKKNKLVACCVLILAAIVLMCGLFLLKNDNSETFQNEAKEYYSEYKLSGNSLEKFDLSFLKLENNNKNKIYSPLSIKYALQMLAEGASGDTKAQLNSIIGDYASRKYANSQYMSFANAMFIRDTYKNNVNSTYLDKLKTKYNAEVIYDSFKNANTMNSWVLNKTFNLIKDLIDNNIVKQQDLILTNVLAINMDWKNMIQPACNGQSSFDDYSVKYAHEDFSQYIGMIMDEEYSTVKFNNNSMNAKAVEIGAAINNYDIVNVLGEENIRKTVGVEYEKWLATLSEGEIEGLDIEKNVDVYLDGYIKELNSNYKRVDSSTDFSLYVDDEVKVFAKDLKEYDGVTLQYVGIMPKKEKLDSYIENVSAEKLNTIISNLKEIKSDNFKEGVVTKVTGYIPLFKFDYQLDLISDLKQLGITDVFDVNKSNLSGISSKEKLIIDSASHKANIEFSNEGIKAAAATQFAGFGSAGFGFEYLYDVPVEEINLTFDNPYMFLIRDKATGEVWFTGTVYEPIKN